MFYTRGGPGMGLLLDDPRLPLAGALVLLLVTGQLLWRVRRRRLVRRQRAEAILRARHLAWVARQEQADRQRDAERARREQQQREREAVQHQAREIAQQIGDDLARIRRMRDAPPQPTPRPVSAVTASTTGTARRPIGKAQGVPPYGAAETTRGERRASTDRAPAGSGSPSGTSGGKVVVR